MNVPSQRLLNNLSRRKISGQILMVKDQEAEGVKLQTVVTVEAHWISIGIGTI